LHAVAETKVDRPHSRGAVSQGPRRLAQGPGRPRIFISGARSLRAEPPAGDSRFRRPRHTPRHLCASTAIGDWSRLGYPVPVVVSSSSWPFSLRYPIEKLLNRADHLELHLIRDATAARVFQADCAARSCSKPVFDRMIDAPRARQRVLRTSCEQRPHALAASA
jgi:hypothetical protein